MNVHTPTIRIGHHQWLLPKGWHGIAFGWTTMFVLAFGLAFCLGHITAMWLATPSSPPLHLQRAVPTAMLNRLETISQADLHRAFPPRKHRSLHAIHPDDQAALATDFASLHQAHAITFVGAGFCPYCAAMRWPLVLAMMRFGHFDNLALSKSGAHDTDPDTATFSFRRARFYANDSDLDFRSLEVMDRQHRLEQRPLPAERQELLRLDRHPYTRFPDAIPVLLIGDRLVQVGSPVPPALFKGKGWNQVVASLASGHGPLWRSVMTETNRLTQAICGITHNQPTQVCGQ